MGKKVYDLEERTYLYAKAVRAFVKTLEKSIWNKEDIRQGVRSSGSVAANYIEVNDSLGPKEKLMKVRICKKEAKETILWLRLPDVYEKQEPARAALIKEGNEIKTNL